MPIEDLIGAIIYRYIAGIDKGSQLLCANYFSHKSPDSWLAKKGICRSSFSEARSKLSWEAFAYLLEEIKCKPKLWKGHKLRAVDGTKFNLPHHREVLSQFPISDNYYGSTHYPQGILLAAADVETGQITNALFGNKHLSEHTCLKDLLSTFSDGDVCLLDRGFYGKDLWFNFKKQNQFFVARFKCKGRGIIKEFNPDLKDQVHEISHPQTNEKMKIRIVRGLKFKSGSYLYIVTNLVDQADYKKTELLNLYKRRQTIEESFKQVKQNLGLELTLRVKKINSLLQEIFAALLAQAFVSVIKYQIEQTHRKTNFNGITYAVAKNFYCLVTDGTSHVLNEIIETALQHYHLLQPGRSYPRYSRQPENKWIKERRMKNYRRLRT